MEDNYNYTMIDGAVAGQLISPGPCKLIRIIINHPIAGGGISAYDYLSAVDGKDICEIITPATSTNIQPVSLEYGVTCGVGLFVVTTGTNSEYTVVWK